MYADDGSRTRFGSGLRRSLRSFTSDSGADMYFDRRLITTEMSTRRVIVLGIALSGKRRMLKSESDVKARAAVSSFPGIAA